MNSRCSKRLDSRLAAVGTKSKRFYVPISLLIKRARPCARVARVRPPVREVTPSDAIEIDIVYFGGQAGVYDRS